MKATLRSMAIGYQTLDEEVRQLESQLEELTSTTDALMRSRFGVEHDTGAALLLAAGDNTERLRSKASLSMLCGASPLPAFSGQTKRHRLNREVVDRQTRPCTGSSWPGFPGTNRRTPTCAGD
jgi:transposase